MQVAAIALFNHNLKWRTPMKTKNKNQKKKGNKGTKKVDPQRRMALESLPPHLREQMTPEEVELFLHAEEWPETLMEKMEEFILPQE